MYRVIRPAVGEASRYFLHFILLFFNFYFVNTFEQNIKPRCQLWFGNYLTSYHSIVLREMPLVELKSKYRKVSSIDKIEKGWQEEYDVASKQVISL